METPVRYCRHGDNTNHTLYHGHPCRSFWLGPEIALWLRLSLRQEGRTTVEALVEGVPTTPTRTAIGKPDLSSPPFFSRLRLFPPCFLFWTTPGLPATPAHPGLFLAPSPHSDLILPRTGPTDTSSHPSTQDPQEHTPAPLRFQTECTQLKALLFKVSPYSQTV